MNKKKVLDFYEIFIEGFIMNDLEVLCSIKPDPISGLKGCTIPTAMTIISSMDLLGFLLNKNGNTNCSKENISYFIMFENKKLFPNYLEKDIDKIFNYRHGMMHHFFPKFKGQFAGICKNENISSLFVNTPSVGKCEESLNVSVLAQDFFIAIEKLKQHLDYHAEKELYDIIIGHLSKLEYYLEVAPQSTSCTTINPGTPKN